jgi:hypothetical protein
VDALARWLEDDTNGAGSVPFQVVRWGQDYLVEGLTERVKHFGSCHQFVEFEAQIHWNLVEKWFEA